MFNYKSRNHSDPTANRFSFQKMSSLEYPFLIDSFVPCPYHVRFFFAPASLGTEHGAKEERSGIEAGAKKCLFFCEKINKGQTATIGDKRGHMTSNGDKERHATRK
jgi:hypothetical protein